MRRLVHGAVIAAGILGIALPVARANADTLATFSWVTDSAVPAGPESGSLVIDLTGNITTNTFANGGTATLGSIQSLSFTFSTGTSVTLANVTGSSFTGNWSTSNANATGGSGAPDLITKFTLTGTNPSSLKLAEAAGSATNVQADSYQYQAANDSGVWQLQSLTPVPLPAGLPLFLSGLGLLGLKLRRRTAAVSAVTG
jgi:hypothetical protein